MSDSSPINYTKTLVYLAVPYSHADFSVCEARFLAVNKVAAALMLEGIHIFSPISHTHPIAKSGDLPRGWDFWKAYDEAILLVCKKLLVLKLEGWDKSEGVAGEMATAKLMNIPIEYLEPTEDIKL